MTRLGIVAEGAVDVRRITGLVDRVLVRDVDWVEDQTIEAYRTWVGVGGEAWLDLHGARDLARARGLRLSAPFVQAVRSTLVPLFTGAPPST